jgi:hypothetical protein
MRAEPRVRVRRLDDPEPSEREVSEVSVRVREKRKDEPPAVERARWVRNVRLERGMESEGGHRGART